MNCDAILDMDIQSKVSNLGYADEWAIEVEIGVRYHLKSTNFRDRQREMRSKRLIAAM